MSSVTLSEGLDDDGPRRAINDRRRRPKALYLDALHQYAPDANVHSVSSELISDSIGRLVRSRPRGAVSSPALVLLVISAACYRRPAAHQRHRLGILVGMGALEASPSPSTCTFVHPQRHLILGLASVHRLRLLFVGTLPRGTREPAGRGRLPRRRTAAGPAMRDLVRATVVRTVATAGRTVRFSALTIACSDRRSSARSPMFRTIAGAATAADRRLRRACTVNTLLGGHSWYAPACWSRVPGVNILRAIGDASSDHGRVQPPVRRVVAHPWIVMLVIAALLGAMASPTAHCACAPTSSSTYHLILSTYGWATSCRTTTRLRRRSASSHW